MANEIELKLRIATSDIPRLRRHPAIKAAQVSKPRTRNLLSIYYDTPQLTLLDLDISLRVRRISRNWIQTIKGKGEALSGLHQRKEQEDNIAYGHPDYSKIIDPELTRIFDDEVLRNSLNPLFSTEVRRTEWQLAFDNGDQIGLALDLGDLVVGEKREPISEIELELKQGNIGRLYELALILQQNIPLELENVSKAQRGYDYYRYQSPVIVKTNPVQLHRDLSAHVALKQIVWECIRHLQGNYEMVLHGDNIEGVHQMRIALRRLRSALNVFRQIASKQSCAYIVEDIRWIAGELGHARDLDVFISQTLPPVLLQLHDQSSLILLKEMAEHAKHEVYVKVREALFSQRYHRLLLTLGDWLENERWRDTKAAEYSVFDISHTMLSKHHKQLKQHGRRLMHAHPEERHATRIAAKKLRYSAEFFMGLYPKVKTRDFLKALGKLLNNLGMLNDITATEHIIHHLIGEHPEPVLNEALYLLTGWNACNAMRYKQDLEGIWNRFMYQKLF